MNCRSGWRVTRKRWDWEVRSKKFPPKADQPLAGEVRSQRFLPKADDYRAENLVFKIYFIFRDMKNAKDIIKKVRKIVEKEANDYVDWSYHILLVVKYSLFLANKYKIKDNEQIELAALLHDIGRLPYSDKKDIDHHISGAEKAEKILKKLNYPKEKISEIKGAIICHRGNDKIKPKTILEKIIANADAMSHFDILPVLYYWRSKAGDDFAEITKWVEDKYDRNWKQKLTLPEAKKGIKDKYLLNKKILKNLKLQYKK